jgi:hypothetical protein
MLIIKINKTRFPKNLPKRQEIKRFNKGNIKGSKYIVNFLRKQKFLNPAMIV